MTVPNIDAGLYAKLVATSALTALVSTRIYNLQAPQGTTIPYVIFYLASGLPDNRTPHQDMNSIYRVECVSNISLSAAYAIQTAVHNALHRSTLTITGWSVFQMQQENQAHFIDNVEGLQVWRVIGDYRIRASLS